MAHLEYARIPVIPQPMYKMPVHRPAAYPFTPVSTKSAVIAKMALIVPRQTWTVPSPSTRVAEYLNGVRALGSYYVPEGKGGARAVGLGMFTEITLC